MTTHRVQYTEVKPGGSHAYQDESVRGDLEAVRVLLDAHRVYALDPIVVTEYLTSDSAGRVVPAAEWDV